MRLRTSRPGERHRRDADRYHVAGLAGALVATLAECGPTCRVRSSRGGRCGTASKRRRAGRLIISGRLGPDLARSAGAPQTLVIARGWRDSPGKPLALMPADRCGHLPAAVEPLDLRHRGGRSRCRAWSSVAIETAQRKRFGYEAGAHTSGGLQKVCRNCFPCPIGMC